MFHFLRDLCCNLHSRDLPSTVCWKATKLVLTARCQGIQFQALASAPPSLPLPHPRKTISLTGVGVGVGVEVAVRKRKSQLFFLN